MLDVNREEWRPVLGYEDRYEVSNLGNVRSVRTRVLFAAGGRCGPYYRHIGGQQLAQSLTKDRYTVALWRGRQMRRRQVHVLVLESFVGRRPSAEMHGCHNDGNPLNNSVFNLRWDTPSANAQDMVRHGTHHEARKTHCPRKHEYTPENTRLNRGKRICKTCHRDRERARNQGKKAA